MRRLKALRLLTAPAILATPASGRCYKTLAEVGQDLQEDLAGFGGLFGSALRNMESKLGVSGGLAFSLDGRGHVLMSRRAQAPGERTELGDDPLFAARFAVIAARSAILNAARTLPGFRSDYQRDAGRAVRTHVDALARRLFGYRLHVENGRIESGHGWSDARRIPA